MRAMEVLRRPAMGAPEDVLKSTMELFPPTELRIEPPNMLSPTVLSEPAD